MINNKIIYHVDAFTTKPFKGNPAAVYIMEKEASSEYMQNIAAEMNLSETAFVWPGNKCRFIRFYTPEAEVDLCGHATLSASHILYETATVKSNELIHFSSKAGELIIKKEGKWITMNFPVYSIDKMDVTDEFRKVTGIVPQELYKSAFGWTLALLRNEAEVRNLSPDFHLMRNSVFGDLIVTSASDNKDFDFCVRCFAPALGINEDPVTGSAHCALAPFWNQKTGKDDFISHQVSKRSGILKVSLKGSRVEISGQAVTILKGELFL
jgi:PhzF family phenazine biosynthesis protein